MLKATNEALNVKSRGLKLGPVKLSVSFVSRDAPDTTRHPRESRAMPSFPVAVASVDEFLAALRMERYADQFASLSVDQLRSLTDKQLRMLGIETVADRKRLLTASVILCIESANKERRTAANGRRSRANRPPRRLRPRRASLECRTRRVGRRSIPPDLECIN